MATDGFGFLPVNRALAFSGGHAEPAPDLEALIEEVRLATREDSGYRWIYPPSNSAGSPQSLFQMPAAHTLTLDAVAAQRSADATSRLAGGTAVERPFEQPPRTHGKWLRGPPHPPPTSLNRSGSTWRSECRPS